MLKTLIKTGFSKVAKLELSFKPKVFGLCFHHIETNELDAFRNYLGALKDEFEFLDQTSLDQYINGDLRLRRNGIILHFDDCYFSQYEYALPVLEEFKIKAWFNLIPEFVDCSPENLKDFLKKNIFTKYGQNASADQSIRSMSWKELLRVLEHGHYLNCHTMSHSRLGPLFDKSRLPYELEYSKEYIMEKTGYEVLGFCWPGGENDDYCIEAASIIKRFYSYAYPSYYGFIDTGQSRYALNRVQAEFKENKYLSFSSLMALRDKSKRNSYLKLIEKAAFN